MHSFCFMSYYYMSYYSTWSASLCFFVNLSSVILLYALCMHVCSYTLPNSNTSLLFFILLLCLDCLFSTLTGLHCIALYWTVLYWLWLFSYTGHMRFLGEIYMYGLVKQKVMRYCILELVGSDEVRKWTQVFAMSCHVLYLPSFLPSVITACSV